MNDNELRPGWERDGEHNITRVIDDATEATIHKYPNCASQYCCHVGRDGLRYCPGIVYSLDEAYKTCEKHLAMPLADFKQLIVSDKLKNLINLHKELASLGHEPTASVYGAGYKNGYQDAKRELVEKVRSLVDDMEFPQKDRAAADFAYSLEPEAA